jgi:hypothetical protein
MSSLTRGGLVPAKLINLSTNEEVNFMFNPHEYALSKSNTYEKKTVIGQNMPELSFQQGGSISLSLKLHFDTAVQGSDVRQYTNALMKMMMIDTTTENQTTGKGSPPPVAFSWGRLYFKAVITNMTQRFTLFKADGTPLRCVVDISLEQMLDDANLSAQVSGAQSGQPAQNTVTATQGDRIDHVAARGTGSASNHRAVAERSNVNNPAKVRNGQQYKT